MRTINAIVSNRRLERWICTLCLLAWSGCGRGDGRQAVEGTVTLDGAPLAHGNIAFRPLPGTSSPTAGAAIADGNFSLSSDQGPREGKFRVEITAPRNVGKKMDSKIHALIDAYEETIHERYNRNSELTAEVTRGGPNRFNFTLKSH